MPPLDPAPPPSRSPSDRETVIRAAGHVVIVVAGLSAGGAERVISLIANDWARRGRRVTIVSFDGAEDRPFHPLSPDIACIRLGIPPARGRIASMIAIARRQHGLRRTLAKLRPDVTISFLTKINALTLLASLGTGRRVIVSERNNPRLQQASRVWSRILPLLYPRAEAIVMQTEASLECLGPSARRRACVIPNPISVSPVPGPPRPKPVLAATGRLARQKGFDLLIPAFAAIADRHPGWILAIWGEGEERAHLEARIAALGLGERIVLRGNSRSTDDWVGQADAFVMSSRFEGFGNALGEAMAAGLPVVTFACDYGPSEMVEHDRNGLLVPNGSVSALSSALDRLMGDAALRTRLGDAARAIGERFHPQVVIAQWDRLLARQVG